VGRGEVALLTDDDGAFSFGRSSWGGVKASFRSDSSTYYWNLFAESEERVDLTPGFYGDATDVFPPDVPHNVIEFYGNGRGCTARRGWFEIFEVSYDSDGNVLTLAMDFVQPCMFGVPPDASIPSLFGSIRHNSEVPVTLMLFSDGFEWGNVDEWSPSGRPSPTN
jgi:hypothetical protein